MTTDRATAQAAEPIAGIEVKPAAGHIGAEITGVDLAADLDDEVALGDARRRGRAVLLDAADEGAFALGKTDGAAEATSDVRWRDRDAEPWPDRGFALGQRVHPGAQRLVGRAGQVEALADRGQYEVNGAEPAAALGRQPDEPEQPAQGGREHDQFPRPPQAGDRGEHVGGGDGGERAGEFGQEPGAPGERAGPAEHETETRPDERGLA